MTVTYLQATQGALKRFSLQPSALQTAPVAEARLGNWTVNYAPIADRWALLFMSDRTYLNFPIMQGRKQYDLQDIPGFMAHGLNQLLGYFGLAEEPIKAVLEQFKEVAITRVRDKSSLAMHAAIVADYAHVLRGLGGLGTRNLTEAILRVNDLPRRKLEWASSKEATLGLLASSAA